MVSKRTYTTSMVQFYIFSLIINSVSCPYIWNQEPANPFITTKTVTSNASSQPHVDVPPAAPPPAEGAGGAGDRDVTPPPAAAAAAGKAPASASPAASAAAAARGWQRGGP